MRNSYDVVIVGGGIMGASAAWWLTEIAEFDGSVLVVERDPSYETASTTHTNSCIRQQFSTATNVRVSQFGAAFIKNFHQWIDGAPQLRIDPFGYLYLVRSDAGAAALREAQSVQAECGAATRLMTPDEIAAEFPFYELGDIALGAHNPVDEGFFDGATMFDWLRRSARARGVEFATDEVTGLDIAAGRVTDARLASGAAVGCGWLVNAAGPRAARVAEMAGRSLPVAPRKRYSFVFDAARPVEGRLPLTIDPSGVHVRMEGAYYLAGCPPFADGPVAPDDFEADHSLWEEKVWPALAARIPQFDALKLINSWVGHYAFNDFDQNAILGPDAEIGNFIYMNGFSGHGLQQSPAMGRGAAELIAHGGFRGLDLSPFSPDRITRNAPLVERAVI